MKYEMGEPAERRAERRLTPARERAALTPARERAALTRTRITRLTPARAESGRSVFRSSRTRRLFQFVQRDGFHFSAAERINGLPEVFGVCGGTEQVSGFIVVPDGVRFVVFLCGGSVHVKFS